MKATNTTREGKGTIWTTDAKASPQMRAMYALIEASPSDELEALNKRITHELAKRNAKALCPVGFLEAREAGKTTSRKARNKIDDKNAYALYVEKPICESIGTNGTECLSVQDARSFQTMPAEVIPEGWPLLHAYVNQVAVPMFSAGKIPPVALKGVVWQACKRFTTDALSSWRQIAGKVDAAYIAFKASAVVEAGYRPSTR